MHVLLDLAERRQLVGRFLIRKGGLELRLPVAVGRQGNAGLRLAESLELDHVAGQVEHRLLDPGLAVLPRRAAQLGELGIGPGAADILLHEVDLGCGHVNAGAFAEFQDQVLFGVLVLLEDLHAAVAGDAVGDMHDQVAFGEIEEAVDGPRFEPAARQHLADVFAVEELVIAEHGDACVHHAETGAHPARHQPEPVGLGKLARGQDFVQAFALGLIVTGNHHAVAGHRAVELVAQLGDVAAEALDRLDPQMTGCLDRRRGQSGDANVGKAQKLLKRNPC